MDTHRLQRHALLWQQAKRVRANSMRPCTTWPSSHNLAGVAPQVAARSATLLKKPQTPPLGQPKRPALRIAGGRYRKHAGSPISRGRRSVPPTGRTVSTPAIALAAPGVMRIAQLTAQLDRRTNHQDTSHSGSWLPFSCIRTRGLAWSYLGQAEYDGLQDGLDENALLVIDGHPGTRSDPDH